YIRLVRSVVLATKSREFVEAARALGRPEPALLLRHIFPACVPTLIVQSAVFSAQNMLMGASLSFLGLGAQPPSPELGAMLGAGRAYLRVPPHVVAAPAPGTLLPAVALNLPGHPPPPPPHPALPHPPRPAAGPAPSSP